MPFAKIIRLAAQVTFALLLSILSFSTALQAASSADKPADTAAPVFSEKDRMAMLCAFHERMSRPRQMQTYSLSDWKARKADLRKRILMDLGLDPLPPAVPLDVTVAGKIERDDCTIQGISFQTFPGLYAIGFLYMPKKAEFPAPAVLHPHGHWANWAADDIVQSRCIGLARRGYVSLVIQYAHYEDINSGMTQRGVFLYNMIRGLDVLESMKEVDASRIGVTGASGGGLQSMMIAGMDDRIRAAAIAVYPTYYQRILYRHASGCHCNYAPLGALRYTDQQEFVALVAPTPTVVFSVTGDWTAESIDHEWREVAPIFNLFGKSEAPTLPPVDGKQPYRRMSSENGLFLVERFEGKHDYTKTMRERMYWWMDWWLRDRRPAQPDPEADLHLESAASIQGLRRFAQAGRTWSDANLAAVVRPERLYHAPAFKTREDVVAYQQAMRQDLHRLLGLDWKMPLSDSLTSVIAEKEGSGEWHMERLWYASKADVKIPAFLFKPAQPLQKPLSASVVLLPNGKADSGIERYWTHVRKELDAGRIVLVPDWRLRGEWAFKPVGPGEEPENTWYGNSLVWGRPELGMGVTDARTAVSYLQSRRDFDANEFRLVGVGRDAGFVALLCAALDPRIASAECDLAHRDFSSLDGAPLLPQILRYGDVGEIAAMVAPQALHLRNVNPRSSLDSAKKAYSLTGASDQFKPSVCAEDEGRDVPVENGGFEEGLAGWEASPPSESLLCKEKADLGGACLRLQPGQTVLGKPLPVKPRTSYRLRLHLWKDAQPSLTIFLQRGEERFPLLQDYSDHIGFQPWSQEFLCRPGETSLRIGFSASNAKGGEACVDTVRLIEFGPIPAPQPNDEELLSIADFSALQEGPATLPSRRTAGAWFMLYGPKAEITVVRDKNETNFLRVRSGPGSYAAISSKPKEPLIRGGYYRLSIKARGKGRLTLNFWDMPPYASPRKQIDLTEDWSIHTLEFFLDLQSQARGIPTASITEDACIESMSLQLIPFQGEMR